MKINKVKVNVKKLLKKLYGIIKKDQFDVSLSKHIKFD